ncbi:hypothetical protein [Nitratidesulfovibrio vulgaris]|uniref:hypothetical protein n=1 Tax=Nitratidesulfovibrio vulgaris TaxID=881 RepID=UPI0023007D54|nr:hypothetical protein [Nitratidesulfovibrio vulgaris]WCB45686.1 hypothetical protein PH214_11525 [Nitratidesulfovibrio vulgaris]
MHTEQRNSHGLFDAPIRFADKETIVLSKEDIERQLDAGAFMMSRDDATEAGFLSPHDDPDTVLVQVREDV